MKANELPPEIKFIELAYPIDPARLIVVPVPLKYVSSNIEGTSIGDQLVPENQRLSLLLPVQVCEPAEINVPVICTLVSVYFVLKVLALKPAG